MSKDETAVDSLQFPRRTLDCRAGECDDLSILASALDMDVSEARRRL